MKFCHIGLSTHPNSHSVEMGKYFSDQGWQLIDIPVQSKELNKWIIQVANEDKPELVFIQIQDKGITKEAIHALRANGAFIINWCGDIRERLPLCYIDYASWGINLTCFSNMRDVETMRKLGFKSDFLQIGYATSIYYPDGKERDIDIVFMGNNIGGFPLSALRMQMVQELKRTYGDRFKAFGIGMPDGNYMGNQEGEAAILRRSKIAINLSHFDESRYTSDRMFRALGSGCCVLSKVYPHCLTDFPADTIGYWSNMENLKEQINGVINDDAFLRKISAPLHELALNNHTFYHMGQNIHKLYEQYKS